MDLNARVDVNWGRKDGQTENRTPISHLAKAGATKMKCKPLRLFELQHRKTVLVVFANSHFSNQSVTHEVYLLTELEILFLFELLQK